MDRTGADNQQETAVVGENEAVNLLAGAGDEGGLGFRLGQGLHQCGRGGEETGFDDVDVGRALHETKTVKEEPAARQARTSRSDLPSRGPEKKLPGRLPLSDRAFAFLVTPKLPLGGRSVKI